MNLLDQVGCEGLSFLTLDAEVKEKLVEDESAMRSAVLGDHLTTMM